MTDKTSPWRLKLFTAGTSQKSLAARSNLEMLRRKFPEAEQIEILVVDLHKNPKEAVKHNVMAIPTLIREVPEPPLRVIGDLSDIERVWQGLHAS